MATFYFGDLGGQTTNGDWNNTSNWFTETGYSDEGWIPGTPCGSLPTQADTVVLTEPVTTNTPASWSGAVVLAASYGNPYYEGDVWKTRCGKISAGSWSGSITGGGLGYTNATICEIGGGTFSGTVSFTSGVKISGSPVFLSAVSQVSNAGFLSGGTFHGAVVWRSSSTANWTRLGGHNGISGGTFHSTLQAGGTRITGGVFHGTVSGGAYDPAVPASPWAQILGGSYEPVVATPVSIIKAGGAWTLDAATLPADPGFKAGGGTFAPVITLSGLPDILGAGL